MGTLYMEVLAVKWYEVVYSDGGTDLQTWMCLAHDHDHAEEKFLDSMEEEGGTQGVKVISVVPHRTIREKIISKLK